MAHIKVLFLQVWTVAQTQILEINIPSPTSLACQNQINWLYVSVIIRLITADAEIFTIANITLRLIYTVLWMLSYYSSSELRKINGIISLFCFIDSVVSLSLSSQHGASTRWGLRNCLQIWRVAVSILNEQSEQKWNGGPSALFLGEVVTNFHLKNLQCYELLQNAVVRAHVNVVNDIQIL